MSLPFAKPANASESTTDAQPAQQRKLALICAKAGLDESYPVLIMANAARMSGIECTVFFTFWGLDVITEDRVDNLYVNMVGNPGAPMSPFLAGLPGMETVATNMMRKQIRDLDIPDPREMITMLKESGCKLYACELAMDMFGRTREDLVPEVEDVITATDFFDKTEGADIVFV